MRDILDINSNDNSLFVTAQCNNRCLMCSQPPLTKDDIDFYFNRNIEILSSAPEGLRDIGITGGEPTLSGDKLFDLINNIREKLPYAYVHILSNGRAFADITYTKKLAEIKNNVLVGVPLHSDYYKDHDYIAQADGSYDETMKGLYNLARYSISIELRIVVNKQNYMRLPALARFIYKNLPFISCVSFMGLEITGYAVKYFNEIWIDPLDYQSELEEAVIDLATWQTDVSIFNLPHCLLKPSLREFARKSISDWKVKYLPVCESCSAKNECCGLFATSRVQSENMKAIL